MICVTDAKTLPDCRLWVRFSDNAEDEIELKDLIASDARPIVAALREPAAFSAIAVEMDTVVWTNRFRSRAGVPVRASECPRVRPRVHLPVKVKRDWYFLGQ